MFCSAACIRDTHESPKIVCRLADTVRRVSKLGKTRIIADASIRRVRNATFFEQNFHLHFHLKSQSVLLIIFLIDSRQLPARCSSPSFYRINRSITSAIAL